MCITSRDVRAGTEMTCPTCGARQQWSDACRRCRCDLVLLGALSKNLHDERLRCLACLRQRNLGKALRHAEKYSMLCPGEGARKLLALCHLFNENWGDAYMLARAVASAHKSP